MRKWAAGPLVAVVAFCFLFFAPIVPISHTVSFGTCSPYYPYVNCLSDSGDMVVHGYASVFYSVVKVGGVLNATSQEWLTTTNGVVPNPPNITRGYYLAGL